MPGQAPSQTLTPQWRLPVGAEVLQNGVRFRVWAPRRRHVDVVVEHPERRSVALTPEKDGYFSGLVQGVTAGALYGYRLDHEDPPYPDPCSRYQPEGPHGPSMVIDPRAYQWKDSAWAGIQIHGQVIYELHIGAFTPKGTFEAATQELPELKDLGVTVIEVMPIADWPGRRNWGYDGVDLYAPAHAYGNPDAFRRFVDEAHRLGLAVILDVVYNHLGPEGNYLKAYSDTYFTDRYENDWGEAINFDGPGSKQVREFFLDNACYWISEYHLDGLRLDATQDIHDTSARHVLSELSERVHEVARPRHIILIAENEPQDVRFITPVEKGGHGVDGMWADDFHHAARVAAIGRREAYYKDYRGDPQEFVSAVKRGFLYQGQWYSWQKQPRGTAVTTEPASAFVFYLQNHDQVANTLDGRRLFQCSTPARARALTALLLLAPETPLLFMGQEFAASTPFLFFADYRDLAGSIYEGRKKFLAQFPSYASPEAQAKVIDPCLDSTFERSKLDLSERHKHAEVYLMHRDLLRLRREDPVIALQDRTRIDGAVIGPQAFALRYFGEEGDDRLLVVNLGRDLDYRQAPEPLLAPGHDRAWQLVWSSDAPMYGGSGIINPCQEDGWYIPANSAMLLVAHYTQPS